MENIPNTNKSDYMETVNAHQASFAQHMKEIADHQALHGYKEVRAREQIDDERTFHTYACIKLLSCPTCNTPEELTQWKNSQNKLKMWYHNQSFGLGFEDTPATL